MDPRTMGLLDTIGLGEVCRSDAKYAAALERQLEFVAAKTYDIKYPMLKGRSMAPVDTSVDPGAETYTYQQWDALGMANIIANYADDLPRVTAMVEDYTSSIISFGMAYDWSVQDLRRAAMSGNQLPDRKARQARKGVELRIDETIAVGHPQSKIKGLVNHPNVTILTASNDGTSTRWLSAGRGAGAADKAPIEIKKDMFAGVNEIFTLTKETFQADTLVLPTEEFGYIKQQPVGTDNQASILKTFQGNNPEITTVTSWHKLSLADAAGTGPRMLTFAKDPDVVEVIIPQDFEQFPAQVKNLSWIVPCHARFGGVVVRYPLAIMYTDGI